MKTIRGLKIAAMLPLGFMILVLLVFGIGETLDGDWGGLQHFVPVLFAGLVIWFCWKRPLWGGILFLVAALFQVIVFSGKLFNVNQSAFIGSLVIMILPMAFSGLLLLTAEWVGRVQHAAPK